MIKINNVIFCKNKDELNIILSSKNHNYEMTGLYKRSKNKILFYSNSGELFSSLLRDRHGEPFLVNATKLNDKIYYQYSLSDFYEKKFGFPSNYLGQLDFIKNIANILIPLK